MDVGGDANIRHGMSAVTPTVVFSGAAKAFEELACLWFTALVGVGANANDRRSNL